MINMPVGPHVPFKVAAGDPVVVSVTYKNKRYKLTLSTAVISVIVAPGDGPGGMPNFVVQSGNIMAINEDSGAS